jgi:hypothetical protein
MTQRCGDRVQLVDDIHAPRLSRGARFRPLDRFRPSLVHLISRSPEPPRQGARRRLPGDRGPGVTQRSSSLASDESSMCFPRSTR